MEMPLAYDAIRGLDVTRGLALMRGNVAKYNRLMSLFADACQQAAAKLPELLAGGDLAAVSEAASSLRGTADLLGAQEISTAAGAAMTAIQNKAGSEEIGRCCAVLNHELTSLVASLRQAGV
jgi:two-component system, sensor histidine kinase and response regulator